MPSTTARVEWIGDFRTGSGTVKTGSSAVESACSFGSIFRDEPGTNPMEMLGASLATCFTGALAAVLAQANVTPKRICADARVIKQPDATGKGFTVAAIHLHVQCEAQGLDQSAFAKYIEKAKSICPVGLALGNVEITIQAEMA